MIRDGKLVCPEVRIEVTNLCNAKCVMCPRDSLTRPQVVMSTKHFKHLVDQSLWLGATIISPFGFGEPLLDKDLPEKIAYCTSLGLETFITSNAQLLDTDIASDLVNAGLTNIRFSVHGITTKTYEAVHRNCSFDTAKRNIFNFIAIARNKVKVHITCIPFHDESIDLFKDFWKSADYLEVWKPHNWAGSKSFRVVNSKMATCGRPFSGPVQINADGKMMLCCFDYDAKMTIGDTYKNMIHEILTISPELKHIQSCHRQGRHDGLPCVTCDQLNKDDKPLLYSSRDHDMAIYKTSTTKFQLGGNEDDRNS